MDLQVKRQNKHKQIRFCHSSVTLHVVCIL